MQRYTLANLLQNIINKATFDQNRLIAIDEYIPYEILKKEPADLKIRLNSNTQPIL